jgi:predicted O-methyltransferase YrrM
MRVIPHFVLWKVGLSKPETQTSDAERECLARHAAGRHCLVEIGVWHGVTTALLRRAMSPDGVLYGVDPYPAGRLGFNAQRLIARHEVAKEPNGSMRWVRAMSIEAARAHASSGGLPPDFIFIDGDHSFEGLRGDWEAWSGLVTPDGVVAVHDSRPSAAHHIENAGSVRYASEIILHDLRFRVVEQVDTLTILHRNERPVTGA